MTTGNIAVIVAGVIANITLSQAVGHGKGTSSSTTVVGRSDSLKRCPDGFDFNATEDCCIREVVEEPMLTCSGFGKLEGEDCVCRTEVLNTCPMGSRRVKRGECELVEEEAAHADCSYLGEGWWHDLDDDMYCLGVQYHSPARTCLPGSSYNEEFDLCTRKQSDESLKEYFCLDGWMLTGLNECARDEIVSCDHPDAEFVEEEGFMGERRLCEECKKHLKVKQVCHVVECRHNVLIPTKGGNAVEAVCSRETIVAPRFECIGGEKEGNTCMISIEEVPQDDCGGDIVVDNGQCSIETRKKAEPFCDDEDWKLRCGSGECTCKRTTDIAYVSECPAEYFLDPSGLECVMLKPPAAYCVNDESYMVDGSCLGVERSGVLYEYTITYQEEDQCLDEGNCVTKVEKKRVSKHRHSRDV